MANKKLFTLLLLLPLVIIGCSTTPAAQPTPPPPPYETDIPAATFTPLPSPTITPTKNPIDFDLTGDWFFLTGNETKPVPGILVQTGDLLTGTIIPNADETVTFEGRFNLLTLVFEGTWSARRGGKGTFTFKLHGSADELVGMTSPNVPFCAARDMSALPKRCDW